MPGSSAGSSSKTGLFIGLGIAIAGAAIAIAIVGSRSSPTPASTEPPFIVIATSPGTTGAPERSAAPGSADRNGSGALAASGNAAPRSAGSGNGNSIGTGGGTADPKSGSASGSGRSGVSLDGVTIVQASGKSLTVAADYDPKHFDPIAYLPRARALARKLIPDAEFTEFEFYENVRPSGVVDLTLPSDHTSYYEFRSPAASGRPTNLPRNTVLDLPCLVNIDITAATAEAAIHTSETCAAPIRQPPRCTFAQIWANAKSEGVPADNVVATVGFLHDGTWFFDLDGVHSYKDCQ